VLVEYLNYRRSQNPQAYQPYERLYLLAKKEYSVNWLTKAPDSLPHYLTALFTLLLAIFAYAAWREATHGTRALQGQLSAMEADQRPWVGIEGLQGEAQPGQDFFASATIKNVGKSPAFNVHTYFKTGVYDEQPTKFSFDDLRECLECGNFLLLPGASIPTGVPVPGTMTTWAAPGPNRKYVLVFGRIDYENSSKQHFWTKVCRYYEVKFNKLFPCPNSDDAM
jgi:hypothetical protein